MQLSTGKRNRIVCLLCWRWSSWPISNFLLTNRFCLCLVQCGLKMAWIKVSCDMLSWFVQVKQLGADSSRHAPLRAVSASTLRSMGLLFLPLPSLICSVQFVHIPSVEYVVSIFRTLFISKASQLDSVHSWFCWGFNEINSGFCSLGSFCFQVYRLVRSMAKQMLAVTVADSPVTYIWPGMTKQPTNQARNTVKLPTTQLTNQLSNYK